MYLVDWVWLGCLLGMLKEIWLVVTDKGLKSSAKDDYADFDFQL
jgi:hypothetical protein